jgi:hypothetical protein
MPGEVGVQPPEGAEAGDCAVTAVATRAPGYALLSELEQAGALSPHGLHLTDPDLTYERAVAIGSLLGHMHQSLRFAIGDWLILIEKLFPAEFSQMAEVLGISEKGMLEYVRVSERVPRSVRKLAPSWSHARAVAALETPQQKEWLKTARDQGLSHSALRNALRPPSEDVEREVCEACGRPL